jgi:hypothetical protein
MMFKFEDAIWNNKVQSALIDFVRALRLSNC